ncbi:DUF1428 domain-containing protein [Aquisalinus flavus]|uniref:RNA signal recognition particle 4.5S RNA n=1 Tax=Aquisalinus flavus TaxID=1526572 RepID=A0A8J2Y702_9PROT|nr:DUF1428 domain-containing protein [Aquisalinus flavus]MBD0425325.1 DUF1428 domain-containing protein [Aquisalinus flavus]UNE49023.1 DUF1428 domain-containing protein [Aquisalinus flavus]GGD16981.1 hypothetical protein GCM10011342_27180 [Aquisalinus flavus]
MTYIDGFLLAVPTARKDDYFALAQKMVPYFKDLGALSVTECWGDDVPDGEVTSFPMAVKLQEDETVVFSWTVWPSKEVRDAAWKKMMEDENMMPDDMPFDGKRMIYGGFVPVVEA